MSTTHARIVSAAATLTLLGVAGCLERKETVRVHRDGSVSIDLTITGDKGDYLAGDAMPAKTDGWSVETQFKTQDDGKETVESTARRRFHAKEPLPDSFADPRAGGGEFALHFPTEVHVERRPDGTYYTFRRTYEARTFARFDYPRLRYQDELKSLGEQGLENLSDDDRRRLVALLRDIEGMRRAELLNAAMEAGSLELPIDAEARLYTAILRDFRESDIDPLLGLIGAPDDEERDQSIDAAANEVINRIPDVVRRTLASMRVSRRTADDLLAAYDDEVRRYEITEDLADEQFEVRLQLPGEIVAHNGDHVDDDGVIVWQFKGDGLHDRDHLLIATSRWTPDLERRSPAEPDADEDGADVPPADEAPPAEREP